MIFTKIGNFNTNSDNKCY